MNTNKQQHKAGFQINTSARRYKKSTNIIVIVTIALALAIVVGAQAFEFVDLIKSHGGIVSVPGDYATIQGAINAANPGDIIQVSPGTYNENLTLSKPVSLIAENFDPINPANNTTILDGGGRGTTILIPPGLNQMPTIRGFVIRNGSGDNILASSAFIAEFNYIYAADNLVSYQMGAGGFNRSNIYFGAVNNAIRLDNMNSPLTVENNRIMYSGASGIEIGLQAATAPQAIVEIGIWNNMILGNGEDGIQFINYASDSQDTHRRFTIAGNLIANNRMAGLGLMPNANTMENYSGANSCACV